MIEVVPVSPSQLLLLLRQFRYVVVQLPSAKVVHEGELPALCRCIHYLCPSHLAFLHGDRLVKFNFGNGQEVGQFQLACNPVYLEEHRFSRNGHHLAFWKTSKVKTSTTITYEVELIDGQEWKRLRKFPRLELTDSYEAAFLGGRLVLAQKSGYGVEVI